MEKKNKGFVAIFVIIVVLIIDQISKVWVKTNMSLYEMIEVTGWFKIYFVENIGMAFGMEVIDKLFLSLFRIVALGFIGYFIYTLVKRNYSLGVIICCSLVWAGASGNIVDSIFYGEIFSASYQGHVATIVPVGEGYSDWLHGKVVDMFYFPLFECTLPSWIPVVGGQNYTFFSYIFNVADAAITVGGILLVLFYRKTISRALDKK